MEDLKAKTYALALKTIANPGEALGITEQLPRPAYRAGLRYPVQNVLELLASGITDAEILVDYEDLEVDDLRACQIYAAGTGRTPLPPRR